jgi:HEAT repeat protein
MFGTPMRRIALLLVLLATTAAVRAEEDDPSLQGKKLSEWIALLQNGKTYTDRYKALLALQLIGPNRSRKVPSALIAAVRENSEEKIRAGAARVLGRFASKAREDEEVPIDKIRDALAATLRADKVPAVRKAAATALGEMKGRAVGAVDVLALALKDSDAGTRTEAASALRQIGKNADDALPDLQATLKNAKLERLTRIHCARALGRIGAPSAVPAVPILKEVLADTKNDSELRRECAMALGEIGKDAADGVSALAAALTAKDSPVALRRAAAEALDLIGADARPALEALRSALKDNDQFVRSLSLHAISRMGKELGEDRKPAVVGILAAMDDNALEVRVAAIEALGNLGMEVLGEQSKDVVNKLTDATRDPRKAVGEAARVALKKLQGMP